MSLDRNDITATTTSAAALPSGHLRRQSPIANGTNSSSSRNGTTSRAHDNNDDENDQRKLPAVARSSLLLNGTTTQQLTGPAAAGGGGGGTLRISSSSSSLLLHHPPTMLLPSDSNSVHSGSMSCSPRYPPRSLPPRSIEQRSGGGSRQRRTRPRPLTPSTTVRILSATYGPSDGRRLLNGEWSSTELARVPYTRDVLPFLRALLLLRESADANGEECLSGETDSDEFFSPGESFGSPFGLWGSGHGENRIVGWHDPEEGGSSRRRRIAIPLMDGKSMNALFGDPCPGTTKRLRVRYVFCDDDDDEIEEEVQQNGSLNSKDMDYDVENDADDENEDADDRYRDRKMPSSALPSSVRTKMKKKKPTAKGDVCKSSFGEHERVVLRRDVTQYQDEGKLKKAVAAASSAGRKKQREHNGKKKGGRGKRMQLLTKQPCSEGSVSDELGNALAMPTVSESSSLKMNGNRSRKMSEVDDAAGGEGAATAAAPEEEEEEEEDDESAAIKFARKMGRSQSIAELRLEANPGVVGISKSIPSSVTAKSSSAQTPDAAHPKKPPPAIGSDTCPQSASTAPPLACIEPKNPPAPTKKSPRNQAMPPIECRPWRLRSATSEIVLPMTLPYLHVRQRALCQLVCKVWRYVVRDWGVAQTVDVNDPSFPNFTRSFLRGVMAQSHSSLEMLFLNDFGELTKGDLHPAIPHLRKLRALDISRCNKLDDTTLVLLSEHVAPTLEILYMKALLRVTDEGLISVCRSCRKLRVLEISNVPITDDGGSAIGENLSKLEALYMRDNYLLTNRSVDVITEKCTKLAQLTLWGCTRLRDLKFGYGARALSSSSSDGGVATAGVGGLGGDGSSGGGGGMPGVVGGGINAPWCGRLVLLNLWGCHSLRDEAANALESMPNLRSLIVSECHRLTDAFVLILAQKVPHIHHLHLRYCRRITDISVNAIADSMHNLYSLDLSFCTKISPSSIVYLLEGRYDTLSELRLYSCYQLDISGPPPPPQHGAVQNAPGGVGRVFLNAIRSRGEENCLSILDVRSWDALQRQPQRGQNQQEEVEPHEDEVFVRGMESLRFEQKIRGFFVRPTGWNFNIQRRLMDQLTWGGGRPGDAAVSA